MNEDTDVLLFNDEHPDGDAGAEDTARMLIEVRAQRQTRQRSEANVTCYRDNGNDNGYLSDD